MNEYFRELRNLGRRLDTDIQKLEKMWETPHLLMSGYGDNVEEAIPYVESFFGTLKEIQDKLIEDHESRAKYLASTEGDLSKVETIYQDVKQGCQDVESLLLEYGYKSLPDVPECLQTIESDTETSILTMEQMDSSILSPVSPPTGCDNLLVTLGRLRPQPKSIATPVIKSIASVTQSRQFADAEVTSMIGSQQEDFSSPYYGRRLK